MNFFKGTFTANTATGNQTISGIGFTPKAIILWTSYQTATGFTDGYQFQIGMTDGTNQNSIAMISDEGAPNDTDRARSETQLVLIRNVAGTNIRVATIVSFGSGQFVVNWSTADAVAAIFHFVAFGGSDLSAAVGNDDGSTANRFVGITFAAQAGFFARSAASGDACNGPNFGWAAVAPATTGGAITQGCASAQVRDNQSTSLTGRSQSTTRCSTIFNSGSQSLAEQVQFTGFGPEPATAFVGGVTDHFLALGGVSAKVGSGLQPTSTGNQAITGLGFTPIGVMLLSVGNVTASGAQTEARFSLGGSDGTNQGWAWTGAVNNVNPIRAAIGHSTTNVVTMSTPTATGSSTTTEAQASFTSFDPTGFTLNWGTADATQREYVWIAFGNAGTGTGVGSAYTFA